MATKEELEKRIVISDKEVKHLKAFMQDLQKFLKACCLNDWNLFVSQQLIKLWVICWQFRTNK